MMFKNIKADERNRDRKNFFPAIVYDKNNNFKISVKRNQIVNDDFKNNQIYKLELNGKEFKAIAREIQKDFIKKKIIHIDFFLIDNKDLIKLEMPIELIGDISFLPGSIFCLKRKVPVEVSVDFLEKNSTLKIDIEPLMKKQTITTDHIKEVKTLIKTTLVTLIKK